MRLLDHNIALAVGRDGKIIDTRLTRPVPIGMGMGLILIRVGMGLGFIFKREILFTPKEFLYTPHITHNPFLHPISLMGCIEKLLGCK